MGPQPASHSVDRSTALRVKSHERGMGQCVQNGHVDDIERTFFRFSTASEAHFAPFARSLRSLKGAINSRFARHLYSAFPARHCPPTVAEMENAISNATSWWTALLLRDTRLVRDLTSVHRVLRLNACSQDRKRNVLPPHLRSLFK